jgi:hypothetical protein
MIDPDGQYERLAAEIGDDPRFKASYEDYLAAIAVAAIPRGDYEHEFYAAYFALMAIASSVMAASCGLPLDEHGRSIRMQMVESAKRAMVEVVERNFAEAN